jgi:hypothetical protein
VPYKLANRWMGLNRPIVRLDLPPELGKISLWVNVRRLKFFYLGAQATGQVAAPEYLVQLRGYDTLQMTWVARANLLSDVPTLLHAYEARPTTAQARKSAPKHAPQPATLSFVPRRSAPIAAS